MRLLACGDRDWCDRELVFKTLDTIHFNNHITVLIHGDCRGADRIAGDWAVYRRVPMLAFPADWQGKGRAAGPIRNQEMLDEGKPDCAVAFHNDLTSSKGTADMVSRCRKAGVSCQVVGHIGGGVSVQTIKPRSGFAL